MRNKWEMLWLVPVAGVLAAAETSRPRGVGPEFAKYYKPSESFTCIANPSIHIPYSQVNDDYCDCPDGSDEPGTSACSHLSPLSPPSPANRPFGDVNTSFSLPGFYCKNKGHRPSYISFQSVNDGVCDYELCCDGSDEWAGVGGTVCADRCKEIGKEWRKQDEQRQRALGAAGKRRKELAVEAARLRKEVEDRIKSLEVEIEASRVKASGLETELAEVERRERGKVVRGPAKGNRVNILASLAKERIEELRQALVTVRGQRDSSRERIKDLEGILSVFKEEYNPNFNDEGVKRAVRSWEEYAARETSADGDAAHDRDLDEMAKADGESAIDWDEWEGHDESDIDVLYKFEAYLPKPARDWVDQKLRDLRVLLIENGILAASDSSSSESKAVANARNALKAVQDDLNNLQSQLNNHREDLNKDYGVDDVFRVLKGQCVSRDSGEYNYELCWLNTIRQKSRKGGGETGLGNFAGMDSQHVDEGVSADGKGLGTGRRVTVRYENGQHCWNGPNRSTLVVLACAEKDEIWKVSEEEKCVYRMEVGTPAVCEATANGEQKGGQAKDEL